MWTLFIMGAGWSQPIVLEGYTSKRWAEGMGTDAVSRFGMGCKFWVTKRPMDNPTPESEAHDG